MTKREFYTAVIEANVSEELTEFATEAIEKLDHTNSLRREASERKAIEKEAEKAPLRDALMKVLAEEPKTATTLIEESGIEVKPQSIPSLLKPFIEDGTVIKVDVKVKGKGTQRGYCLAAQV